MSVERSESAGRASRSAGVDVAVAGEGDRVEPLRLPPEIPQELRALCEARATCEVEAATRYTARTKAANQERDKENALVEERHARVREEIAREAEETIAAAESRLSAELAALEQHEKGTRQSMKARFETERESIGTKHEQSRWEAATFLEAAEKGEKQNADAFQKALAEEEEAVGTLTAESDAWMARMRKYGVPGASSRTDPRAAEVDGEPLVALRAARQAAEEDLVAASKQVLPRVLAGPGVIWLCVVPFLVIVGPAVMLLQVGPGLGTAAMAALAAAVGLRFWLYGMARRSLAAHVPGFLDSMARTRALLPLSRTWGEETLKGRLQAARERHDSDVRRADRAKASGQFELEEWARRKRAALDEEVARGRETQQSTRDTAVREAEQRRTRRSAELAQWCTSEAKRITDEHARRTQDAEARRARDRAELVAAWRDGHERLGSMAERVEAEAVERFLDWSGENGAWAPRDEVPPALRFGRVDVALARIPHGISQDAELRALAPESYELPALLTFPERGSLLVRETGGGEARGIEVLQAVMLRWLTSLPPGKVRFTILDPVGRGRNFAAFMHLADYSELLVTSRIWTEPGQIEQRLADLQLHMENVIQQFLRNEFAALEDYNKQAAEVAEPYRVLVVADFPKGFQESSVQRLLSIATGGARCGIYTLILVDESEPLQSSVHVAELEKHAATLVWERDHFVWRDPWFSPFELVPDVPPPDERLTALLHDVGRAARDANRVEVPFEVIAPERGRWWTGSTREGLDVPLGRAGATKLQALKLGRGTSQHVLIAGRTGSGKSTLLHALIVNASLIHSPEEVEFYLIDFKKGVEFKTYADFALPHARVVAIESEREFGISVLQRLDEELKRRGEMFRAAGVQDLPGYRGVKGTPPLPRTLLIVDEFQEFFVEDDKVAQDAALLLDRLVRQGRAFGIHVHLGSQTLSGAYSLARSTLGQMAVRIALQCSEADAHLILSEDNAAARLLSRPGEAIYNDANGMVEGNHVFQVVWLPEARRGWYLQQIGELERSRPPERPRPLIVFEGNVPSRLSQNIALRELIDAGAPDSAPRAPVAWLGEAVAIKDPTAAVFRRQGGNQLLVIGQDAPGARGVFAAALVSLAAQHPRDAARFYVLDGTVEDDPERGALDAVYAAIPQGVDRGGTADAGRVMHELGDELRRRQEGAGGPAIFLFLFDGSRFRDLRKSDDDFGFGRRGEEEAKTASQELAEILREGPALGIHVIAWFDTLNNVQRVLDRTALREFEMRVLFQMSANDSSALIDSPLANRLGAHRALFSSEEQGKLEKFRPYGVADGEWLAHVGSRLCGRA